MANSWWTPDYHIYTSLLDILFQNQTLIWSRALCSYNRLHSSGNNFHKIFECVCGNFFPISFKVICEVGYWCWMRSIVS